MDDAQVSIRDGKKQNPLFRHEYIFYRNNGEAINIGPLVQTRPAMLNTTPHAITLRRRDGTDIMVEAAPKHVQDAFRAVPAPNELLADLHGVETVTASAYSFQLDAGFKLPAETDTLIVSTITASSMADGGTHIDRMRLTKWFGRDVNVAVPYSGPDPEKCERDKGRIVRVMQLIQY